MVKINKSQSCTLEMGILRLKNPWWKMLFGFYWSLGQISRLLNNKQQQVSSVFRDVHLQIEYPSRSVVFISLNVNVPFKNPIKSGRYFLRKVQQGSPVIFEVFTAKWVFVHWKEWKPPTPLANCIDIPLRYWCKSLCSIPDWADVQ